MSEQTSPLHEPAAAFEAPAEAPGRSPIALPSIHLSAIASDTTRLATLLILGGILVFAAGLRWTHNNWDNGAHLHPDERFLTQISGDTRGPSSIANFFDTDTSAANPYNIKKPDGGKQTTFVYGTLPLFLNKFVASHTDTPYNWVDRLTMGNGDAVNSVIDTVTFGQMQLPERAYDDYDHFNLSGRALSALFDLGTIVFIFCIGRALANRNVGLLAAFLYALSAFPIQNAHFFVVDPFVTFFAAGCVYFAIQSAKFGRWRDFALAGTFAGLAAASKITAISLLPVAVLSVGVYVWPGLKAYVAPWWAGDTKEYENARDGRALDRSVFILVFGSIVVLLAGFIAFRIAMPYAFNSPSFGDWLSWRRGAIGPLPTLYPDIMNQHWLGDQVDQQNLLGGNAAFPPNVQWIGRSKWLWPAQQMVAWGMGPALGVTAWLGLVFAAIYAARKRQGVWLVPLAWILGYFAIMGAQYSLYMRYFLPLYPVLTVFAAFLMYKAWTWANEARPFDALGERAASRLRRFQPALPVAVRSGVVVIIVFTGAMGLAFYNIYRSPVTRAAASVWIYENVPEGATISHEHWDDGIPYTQPGVPTRTYDSSVEFDNFNNDSVSHVEKLLANIDQTDYIALSSRRLSGTISRVPAVWPITSRYYADLESLKVGETGGMGFKKVAEFTQYPSIFGFTFNDTGAEESYSVYDHPKVQIFEKTDEYSARKAREFLHADAFVPGISVLPGQAAQNGLVFRPDVLATQKAGGTFSDIFHPGDVFNRFPLFFWLLALELAAFSLVPLALVGFRGLPDRGFLLTKPLGLLVLSYFAYLPAAYGLVHYTRGEIAGALGIMVAIGLITGYAWRNELRTFVRERWRFILMAEAIFLFAFLLSYWIRLQNPDLWHPYNGGEKPMDFAYLNGVTRSTDLTQGPIDPWFAGGYLNYYWYGQFIASTITKLTGIVPEVAYNLIVPMFFALAAASTFSLAYNLSESTRRLMKRRPGGLPISPRGPIIAGLLAIFFVMLAGNLKAVGVLEQNLTKMSSWHSDVPLLGGIVAIVGGFKAILFHDGLPNGAQGEASFQRLITTYDWWAPSRALDIISTPQNGVQPITEFPFWTFLFADLHAHLIAIPFSMTAAAVGLGAVLNFTRLNPPGEKGEHLRARTISSWGIVVVLALIIGALRWINSWDYPPFLLIGMAALLIAERSREGSFTMRALSRGLLKTVVMVVLSYAFYATIAKNYSQAYSSFHQSDQTTALGDYLSHFGVLLFFITGFALFALNRSISRTRGIRWVFFGRAGPRQPVQTMPVMVALMALGAVIIWVASMERSGVTYLAVVGLIAIVLCAAREIGSPTPTSPIMLFVYAMIALGLGLTGGVEILTLDGDIGRMNTVFKFYLHVWMMWGVVAAFSAWYIFGVMRPQEAFLRRAGTVNTYLVRAPRYAFAAFGVILLTLALVYPYFGTRARIHDRFDPGLGSGNDGLAFMDSTNISRAAAGHDNIYSSRYDATNTNGDHELRYTRDAVNWIRQNVKGSPTTFEAIGPSYRSLGSRISIYTGLPTVAGWGFHQSQQRAKFNQGVQDRQRDVTEFYTTTDVSRARELIRKYDVEWVIVGDEEKFNYPEAGIAKFKDGLLGALELAYENPAIQVWHVVPRDQLATSSTSATPNQ